MNKIEQVGLPKRFLPRVMREKFPFGQMKHGDSFFEAEELGKKRVQMAVYRENSRRERDRSDVWFTTHREPGGIRVYAISRAKLAIDSSRAYEDPIAHVIQD